MGLIGRTFGILRRPDYEGTRPPLTARRAWSGRGQVLGRLSDLAHSQDASMLVVTCAGIPAMAAGDFATPAFLPDLVGCRVRPTGPASLDG